MKGKAIKEQDRTLVSLEEQIEALERALENDSDDSSGDSDSDSDASKEPLSSLKSECGGVLLSNLHKDRIPALPSTHLPHIQSSKRTLNILIGGDPDEGVVKKKKNSRKHKGGGVAGGDEDEDGRKKVRFGMAESQESSSTAKEKEKEERGPKKEKTQGSGIASSVSSGLENTVKEMLSNYTPSSSERRAFWCRICRFQGDTEEELKNHRLTELHILASEKERKLSFCRLCKKQFTSPDQLQSHLVGKGHVEMLAKVKGAQKARRPGLSSY
jgi:hypothetical protein